MASKCCLTASGNSSPTLEVEYPCNKTMNKVRVIKNGKELIIRKAVKEDSAKIIEHMSFIGGESDNLTFGANEWNMTLEMEEQFIESINKKGNFKLGGLLCLNLMC